MYDVCNSGALFREEEVDPYLEKSSILIKFYKKQIE
jgi:hypothetical protein